MSDVPDEILLSDGRLDQGYGVEDVREMLEWIDDLKAGR